MLRKRSIRLTIVGAVLGVLLLPLSTAAATPASPAPIGLFDWTGPHSLLTALWDAWRTPGTIVDATEQRGAWHDRSFDPGSAPSGDLGQVIAGTGSDIDPDGCIANPDGTISCPPPSGDPNTGVAEHLP